MKMIFESEEYTVIAPLDPSEGGRYVETSTDNILKKDVNQLYRTITRTEDYINPTADGMLVDFNLVQLFIENRFSVKEQKK
jgi:hypothetical protein